MWTPKWTHGMAVLCATALLWGCGDEQEDPKKTPKDNNKSTACEVQALSAQPTTRFVQGRTFYLPTISKGDCKPSDWTLFRAPQGQKNAVQADETGARFTPVVPGEYVFALENGEEDIEVTLNVVSYTPAQFMNYNYYQTRSVIKVGEELWAASVYSPQISRINPDDLSDKGTILAGSWPVALAHKAGAGQVVVANRGSDTLGIIDVESKTLVDAVWVGDEPSNVVLSPDGQTAYVVLYGGEVVAVDLTMRTVKGRVQVLQDASAVAISPDGQTLYVAAYRSGHPQRFPYEDGDKANEKDIAVINTTDMSLTKHFIDVGTTIRWLELSEDGKTLYVANTTNNGEDNLADENGKSFVYEVLVMDASTGDIKKRADLSRQDSSKGFAVHLYGMALTADRLWVVAEASDALIGLNRDTLAEEVRVKAPGRPRAITMDEKAIYMHGAPGFVISRMPLDKPEDRKTSRVGVTDPRTKAQADGQRYFTGAGEGYAQNWSCNSCHADAMMDKVVWNAGPFEDRVVSRPFFWLEGTYPLGWAGYLSSVRNYAFTVNTNVGVRPDTKTVNDLTAYLASLMPPPAANSKTLRDGSLSEQALRGKALFEGKAACAGCHAAPLTTSRASTPDGVTEGITDIPALVGAYRYGTWLKLGQANTMRDAVVEMLKWTNKDKLSDTEVDDLTRYMDELTARDFFVLSPEPRNNAKAVGVDTAVRVIFSQTIFDDPANLEQIKLLNGESEIAVERTVEQGRHVILTPKTNLEPGTQYTIKIDESVVGFAENKLSGQNSFQFTTAKASTLKLEGDYLWVVDMPTFRPDRGAFDPTMTSEVSVRMVAQTTASGATFDMDYLDGLTLLAHATLDGDVLNIEPLPVPIGPSFADTTGLTNATVKDNDGDGIIDEASGTLTMSGPGFIVENVTWSVRRPPADNCIEGATGEEINVNVDAAGLATVDFGMATAFALFITDPGATIPMGPGMVMGGDTFLALSAKSFAEGFKGPVTMGMIPDTANDNTEANGGMAGGTPLVAGECYKVFGLFEGFMSGQRIFRLPKE